MNRFKIGDRVVMVNMQISPGNPKEFPKTATNKLGNTGSVIDCEHWNHYRYIVKWDNGNEAHYADTHLDYENEDNLSTGNCIDE